MKLVEQFETLNIEEAKSVVMQELSLRALRMVSEGIETPKETEATETE